MKNAYWGEKVSGTFSFHRTGCCWGAGSAGRRFSQVCGFSGLAVGNAADFAPSPACGPPSAEATACLPYDSRSQGGGPKPFALRPKAAFWRRVGGRRPACGPPSAEATACLPYDSRSQGAGPKPFALRPKAAFWRRVGGRRPEGFGPAFRPAAQSLLAAGRSVRAGRPEGEKHEVYATGFRL
jgi:hypothetical protein